MLRTESKKDRYTHGERVTGHLSARERPVREQSSQSFRALELTYLRPAPTQELAAERLGAPFSTYRRHLTRAVDFLVERLWERELSA